MCKHVSDSLSSSLPFSTISCADGLVSVNLHSYLHAGICAYMLTDKHADRQTDKWTETQKHINPKLYTPKPPRETDMPRCGLVLSFTASTIPFLSRRLVFHAFKGGGFSPEGPNTSNYRVTKTLHPQP